MTFVVWKTLNSLPFQTHLCVWFFPKANFSIWY